MTESTVAALVVTRGLTPYLQRTIKALKTQTRQPDAILVINTALGKLEPFEGLRVLHAPNPTSFNQAIQAAMATYPKLGSVDWLWFLHDDSAPAENCLELLLNATKAGLTTAVVGPKQVAWSANDRILEVGVKATRSGRRLSIESTDEIDQGQYDDLSDVLAVGTAGMLVSGEVWAETGGFDDFLTPYGEGLEFCRRVRLGGHRVVVVPEAKLAHARLSYRGLREADEADITSSFRPRRLAQLYNGLILLNPLQFVLSLILLPGWTLLRALWRLVEKRPSLATTEVAATVQLYLALPNLLRARKRTHQYAKVPTKVLRNLEASHAEINHRRRVEERKERRAKKTLQLEPIAAKLWQQHRVKSFWLGAFGFTALLITTLYTTYDLRAGIHGSAWFNLPDSYVTLFSQAWSGWNQGGLGGPPPVDTLLPALTVLTAPLALFGFSPQTQWLFLWQIAPALAWLAAYWGTRIVTHRAGWRFLFATFWVGTPVFLLSWNSGRMSTVLAAIFIPLFARAWLHTIGQSLPLQIRGAFVVDMLVDADAVSYQYVALASFSLLMITSAAPWSLLLLLPFILISVGVVSGRRLSQLLLPVPAALFTLPLWIYVVGQPNSGWQVLFADTGLPAAYAQPNTWEIGFGLPVDHHQLGLAFEATLPSLLQPVYWLLLFLPQAFLLAGAVLGLLNLQRLSGRSRFSFLLAVLALLGGVVASRLVVASGSSLIYGWAGIGILLATFAFKVASAGSIPVLALEEKINSYAWRRRLEKAAKRQEKAARKLAKSTGEEAPEESAFAADLQISEDGKVHHRSVHTSFSERSAYRSHLAATVVFALVLTIPTVLLQPTFLDRAQTVQPAPTYLTPAATVEAQQSERAARFLRLQVTDTGVEAEVWRGDGRQLADSTVVQRWERAQQVKAKTVIGTFNVVADSDPAHAHLATLVASLLTEPDSFNADLLTTLAVDGVALELGDSLSRERALLTLDRVGALERAGESGAGTLWRVRPNQLEPSRVYLKTPSGIIPTADPTISNVEIGEQPADTLLVLAEPADPAWNASINGVSLEPTSYQWMQAFKLPAEGGSLRLSWYADWLPIWWLGAVLSLIGIIIGAIPVTSRRRLDVE